MKKITWVLLLFLIIFGKLYELVTQWQYKYVVELLFEKFYGKHLTNISQIVLSSLILYS